MADRLYAAKSGFYNSVGGDRLYDATDMCKPYTNIVSDGIYPVGDVATEGFAVTPVTGLKVSVAAGNGLFHGKWLALETAQEITCGSNDAANPRIDSILIQINENTRVGGLVLRTGTPAANPSPPAINQVAGVYEWRICNITRASGSTVISAGNITDLRTWAVLNTGTQSGQFTVKSGSPTALQTVLVANGKVVTFFIGVQATSSFTLAFPDGFEPDDIYDGTIGGLRFPTFGITDAELYWATATKSGLDDKWYLGMPQMVNGSSWYCHGTYIRK